MILTPEQAQDLVDHFGNQSEAARDPHVPVAQSTISDCLNPDRKREADRKRYAENPERQREASRKWHAKHPERQRETNRKWREANLERAREASRKWNAENPERQREASARYRSTLNYSITRVRNEENRKAKQRTEIINHAYL